MKVFYADDDADEIELFCEALKLVDDSIQCISATDSEKGPRILDDLTARELPDFIFFDMNMPKLNGGDCLKWVKKNKLLKNTPVVIYSTSVTEKDRALLFQDGADHIILKQHDLSDLCDILRSLFIGERSAYG